MKKYIIMVSALFTFMFMSMAAFGAQVDYDTVAANFLKFRNSDKKIESIQILYGNTLDPDGSTVEIAGLVNLEKGGYILISATMDFTPVKAYSLEFDFSTLPPAYREFLLSETEYNVRTSGTASGIKSLAISPAQQSWNFLLNFGQYRTSLNYTPNTNLLTTTWDQGAPYNKFLPEEDNEKVWAGCINVAMAQLMKYHGYPATGRGVASYTWNSELLKTSFNRPFNWEDMPDTLNGAQPGYQEDEVALLIRDIAIVNQTNFGTDGSSAYVHIDAFEDNFGYAATIKEMNNSDPDFFDTLRNEISSLRPVILSFPGHMTVADGYSSEITGKEIHVNFGWSGNSDGYYFLDLPVEAGSYTFQPDLRIHYDIKPCSEGDCDWDLDWDLESDDTISGQTIYGCFDYEQDRDQYEVYLKGTTTITGDSGTWYQGFYISLYDSDNVSLTSSKPVSFTIDLPEGLYVVRTSLCETPLNASCYDSHDGTLDYTVSISTSSLTQEEKYAIDAASDKGPVINTDLNDLLLTAGNTDPYYILVDARDENGDAVSLGISNSNAAAVQVSLLGNVLSLTPGDSDQNIASTVTVIATANGKATEKSFVVMLSEEEISFGKSFEVKGLFENQDDFNTHRVILDGDCTVKGGRGYSNQAFFSSVLDTDQGTIVALDDTDIIYDFPGGIYLLGASLRNPGVSYYIYEAGTHANYTLSVSCPDVDDQTTAVAALLGIDLSGAAVPEITYNPATLTNQDVVATITLSDGMVTSDGGATHTFIENGSWTFELTDAVGNTGTAVATVNWIDKTAPTAIINAPTGVVNYQTASITVNGADVIQYKYKLDDENVYSSVIESNLTIEFYDLPEGSHTLYVIGCDNAGNWQSEASATTASWDIHLVIPGDVNDDGDINLVDLILSLQSLIGVETPTVNDAADISRDNTIGLEEVIYILQMVSGVRD